MVDRVSQPPTSFVFGTVSAYLHPEVSPLSPPTDLSPPLLRASPAPLVPEITKEAPLATNPVSLSPAVTAPALWVSKLKASTHNLKKLASPTFAADGTPVVRAPESVIFKSSNLWKHYIVAQFHGTPPSPTKIFSDLNPIWGKHGRIKVKQQSHDVCFILIPCEITRKWALLHHIICFTLVVCSFIFLYLFFLYFYVVKVLWRRGHHLQCPPSLSVNL